MERLLYRISINEKSKEFILKGAHLFALWYGKPFRPTRDIDFLGFGSNEIQDIEFLFNDVCNMQIEDGIVFNLSTLKVRRMTLNRNYPGARVMIEAFLGKSKIMTQVDLGFGDILIGPPKVLIVTSKIRDLPSFEIFSYPIETVIAEKLNAIVELGMVNTRFKDFYDLYAIVQNEELDRDLVKASIATTFSVRGTSLPGIPPTGLTEEFYANPEKIIGWKAFLKKNQLDEIEFSAVVLEIRHEFLTLLPGVHKIFGLLGIGNEIFKDFDLEKERREAWGE